MKYDVVLTGNKTISITEDEKKYLDGLLKDKENGNTTCVLGKNTVRLSMVKGIFESGTVNFTPMNEAMERKHQEWNDLCKTMSKMSMKDKIDNELTVRILPMFQKTILDEITIAVLRQTMEAFFTVHPMYPRCPSHVWWGIIKDKVDMKLSKWMEIVIRNDGAIEDYIKYHHEQAVML